MTGSSTGNGRMRRLNRWLVAYSSARANDRAGPITSAPDLADAELVDRIARSAPSSAVTELYRRYGRVGYSLARQLCDDDRLAEEVVLDVFRTVWHAPGHFDPGRGSVATQLLLLVHHKAVAARRQGRVRRNPRPAADAVDRQRSLGSGRTGLGQGGADRLHGVLQELPLEQRRALMLAYYEGHTESEVAAIVDAPVGTVRCRMAAAVRRLRVQLQTGTAPPAPTEPAASDTRHSSPG